MALLDRLLPAWRHRDPEVRAAAVRDLGDEARDVLATVARGDADARVRRIAVKKIDDDMAIKEIEAFLAKNAHRNVKPDEPVPAEEAA